MTKFSTKGIVRSSIFFMARTSRGLERQQVFNFMEDSPEEVVLSIDDGRQGVQGDLQHRVIMADERESSYIPTTPSQVAESFVDKCEDMSLLEIAQALEDMGAYRTMYDIPGASRIGTAVLHQLKPTVGPKGGQYPLGWLGEFLHCAMNGDKDVVVSSDNTSVELLPLVTDRRRYLELGLGVRDLLRRTSVKKKRHTVLVDIFFSQLQEAFEQFESMTRGSLDYYREIAAVLAEWKPGCDTWEQAKRESTMRFETG